MTALLLYLDTENLLLLAGLACAIHECGHCAAVRLVGGRISRLRLTAVGGELQLDWRRPLTKTRELFCILAGPFMNLLTAWLLARKGAGETGQLLGGISVCLGVFNLLPIWPLDGGRVLQLLLEHLLPERWALHLVRGVSVLISGILLFFGLLQIFYTGGNLTLCVLAAWLFIGIQKRGEKTRRSHTQKIFLNGG
jgi:stage IV sporulation protein FB